MTRTVIDVSEHQGVIDWDAAASSIDGAIIRLGYGSDYPNQDDAQATRNMDECERLGIPYGAYLYSYASGLDDIASEAVHALRMLEGRNPVLGVWFDTEQSGLENVSRDYANIFCRTMRAAGYRTGVYCYQSWYWAYLEDIEKTWPIWFASYTDSPSMPENVYAWQYTSDGGVDGIGGRVDINLWYHAGWFESEDEMINDDDIARIWAYHYENDDDNWDCYTKLRECAKHVQYHESRCEGGDGGDTRTRIDFIDERVKQINAKLDKLIEKLGV